MLPYTKEKIDRLQHMIDVLSDRQKKIDVEMHRIKDINTKNKLGLERQDNTAALRIMFWIMKELKGKGFDKKIQSDPQYPRWICGPMHGYHIHETLATELEMEKSEYWCTYKYCSPELHYFNQRMIYYKIIDYLFPKNSSGIFGLLDENSAENDIWRTRFDGLIVDDWEKFKEKHCI